MTYPPGIRFDTDMTVSARRQSCTPSSAARKSTSRAASRASSSGSSWSQAPLSIEIEFCSAVQKVHIDGAVQVSDKKICVDVHAQFSPTQTFHFLIEVKFVDALLLELKGTLEGVAGKDVDGCEFQMYGKMEQKLVEYIVDLANEHFEKEGQFGRKEVLQREARHALEKYQIALVMSSCKGINCASAMRVVEEVMQNTQRTIRDKEIAAEETLQAFRVMKENEERELKARIEREWGEAEQEEQEKTAAMVLSVEQFSLAEIELKRASVELRGRSHRATAATQAKQSATGMIYRPPHPMTALTGRTDELEWFEQQCAEDLAKEPSTFDPAHAAWVRLTDSDFTLYPY